MKKNEVKVGQTYQAKVSDRIVTVRIDSPNSHGGWNATNTATGKRIRIKSPQRLRRAVGGNRKTKITTTDAREAVEAVVANDGPAAEAVATAEAKPAKKARSRTATGEPRPKRISALDAAAEVLKAENKPMKAKDLIEAMAARGLWSSPNGKTPEATLYAAMLREITTKGDQARFRKADRGLFEFNAATVEA
ncbi:MAG: winged helix-turn-helix domain-containing protein [Anaerolineae bacterium]|nr:winged helix-turn-helix domain-containing protein [Anaerolineae bacterium]